MANTNIAKYHAHLALGVGLTVLSGCSDSPIPVAPSDQLSPALHALDGPFDVDTVAHPGERRAAQLARSIPGLAGYHFDDSGSLIIQLTDLAQEPAARTALAPLAKDEATRRARLGRSSGGVTPTVIVKAARYRFEQLSTWRDQVTNAMLSKPGVVFTDLDEVENRVTVGVRSADLAKEVESRLAQIGIPRDAVVVEISDEIRTNATLNDFVRPILGGLQGTTFVSCTIGFPARTSDGKMHIVVNSHCSTQSFGLDGTSWYQGGGYIGVEARDSYPNSCFTGTCRWSDAAYVAIAAGVSIDLGYVARTTYLAAGPTGIGSTTMDPANPRFRIISEYADPVLGTMLDKVGRTTGWTYGSVKRTCVDVDHPDIGHLRCQYEADYGSAGGDSGSPVFVNMNYYDVRLVGIHWGSRGTGSSQRTLLSPIDGIERDLGGVATAAP